MAKLIEKPSKKETLEVGDIIMSSHGPRLVVYGVGEYFATTVSTMIIAHSEPTLEALHDFYSGARIIKADKYQIVEV